MNGKKEVSFSLQEYKIVCISRWSIQIFAANNYHHLYRSLKLFPQQNEKPMLSVVVSVKDKGEQTTPFRKNSSKVIVLRWQCHRFTRQKSDWKKNLAHLSEEKSIYREVI